MDLKFKFNANEFAKLNGITPSALRKRRLSGKLEGQYIKKGSDYFYTPSLGHRPNNDEFTLNNSRSKPRRRNVSGSDTRYHKVRNGHQFKLTNDLRQLARINKRLDIEELGFSFGVGFKFKPVANQINLNYYFGNRKFSNIEEKEFIQQIQVGISLADIWFVKRRQK